MSVGRKAKRDRVASRESLNMSVESSSVCDSSELSSCDSLKVRRHPDPIVSPVIVEDGHSFPSDYIHKVSEDEVNYDDSLICSDSDGDLGLDRDTSLPSGDDRLSCSVNNKNNKNHDVSRHVVDRSVQTSLTELQFEHMEPSSPDTTEFHMCDASVQGRSVEFCDKQVQTNEILTNGSAAKSSKFPCHAPTECDVEDMGVEVPSLVMVDNDANFNDHDTSHGVIPENIGYYGSETWRTITLQKLEHRCKRRFLWNIFKMWKAEVGFLFSIWPADSVGDQIFQ